MKIATWNIERLKHKKSLHEMLAACDKVHADILVLTETDRRFSPEYRFCFQTPSLAEIDPAVYKPTENRVSIYTNYPCIREYSTYDENTAICVELETERGHLLVYGTIIGIYGNRHVSFKQDLDRQIEDIERLSKIGDSFLICGDFNCSFADNYYYTKHGRDSLLETLSNNSLSLLTKKQSECIDHIAITSEYVSDAVINVEEWNEDKRLSDHKGIAVSIM